MAPVATILSYRLGGTDGVSIEAAKWGWALRELGFEVRRVAGELDTADAETPGPDDQVVEGLSIGADDTAEALASRLGEAIGDSDLVVAENICSLPVNVAAATAAARALAEHSGRVLLHHHDLPWQRRHLASLESAFPPAIDGALHVTINLRSKRELASRRIEAVAIHNRFDFDRPAGDRAATRAAQGFDDAALVVLQPTRAIERKNVPGAVRYLHELTRLAPNLDVRYWLTGPAEDGYASTLERVLDRCDVPVTLGRAPTPADAYAACDVVLFPSTWEGFGNPTLESVWARRPAVVFPYPVLSEITAFGIQFLSPDAPEDLVRFLARPDANRFEVNLSRARTAFSLEDLPSAIDDALAGHGWLSW